MTEELEVIGFAFEGRDMNKELEEAKERIAELEAEQNELVYDCRDYRIKLDQANIDIECHTAELAALREWFLDDYGGQLPLKIMEILGIDQGSTKERGE